MSKHSCQHARHDAASSGSPSALPQRSRRGLWVFLGFVAVAGFFLLTEHRAHLFGILPYLLLLACPLMHWFHHRGHGGRHPRHGRDAQAKPDGEQQ